MEANRKYQVTEECLKAFNDLKDALVSAHILTMPDWDSPFVLLCDANDVANGAVLVQKQDKTIHPIITQTRH